MSGLDYLSEREWVIFTIEEELGRLERLIAGGERLRPQDLEILAQCQARLQRMLAMSAGVSADEPLPAWLRRKEDVPTAKPSDKRRSA